MSDDGLHDDRTLERVLAEAAWVPSEEADPDLAALQIAILLEDALGITLTDSEIDTTRLSTPEGIRSLIRSHRGS